MPLTTELIDGLFDVLVEEPILLLVLISAVGYALGQIRVGSFSLGAAGVLFAGLLVGATDERLALPEFTTILGLALFVYAVGLSSGPGFFASLGRKSLVYNAFVAGALSIGVAVLWVLAQHFGLSGAMVSGIYAGSMTNTPALAAVLQIAEGKQGAATADLAVVGYSVVYPFGILGLILLLALLGRFTSLLHPPEEASHPAVPEPESFVVHVTRQGRVAVADLEASLDWKAQFIRIRREGHPDVLATAGSYVEEGDLLSIVAEPDDIPRVLALLGERVPGTLAASRAQYDYRRIFVSREEVAGRRIRDVHAFKAYGAIVTRVRRGDVEWVARPDTVLVLGDRIRVVARPEDLPGLSEALGDSYKALSEINLFTFSIGLLGGMLLGLIPIPLPGGLSFSLGLAGGPLLVGLLLGKKARTGPLVWSLPYSANLLIRQLGLVLFFAGVGVRAGYSFFSMMQTGQGWELFAIGAAVTLVSGLSALMVGRWIFRFEIPFLLGMIAGMQTQPAVLKYVQDQFTTDQPTVGYATVLPVAICLKILIAQLFYLLL